MRSHNATSPEDHRDEFKVSILHKVRRRHGPRLSSDHVILHHISRKRHRRSAITEVMREDRDGRRAPVPAPYPCTCVRASHGAFAGSTLYGLRMAFGSRSALRPRMTSMMGSLLDIPRKAGFIRPRPC